MNPLDGQFRRHTARPAERGAINRAYIGILAIVAIIGSVVSLYLSLTPRAGKTNLAPFVGLGQVLADETVKAIDDQGQVVVVVSDLQGNPGSTEHKELTGFLGEIARHNRIRIAATEKFKIEAPPIEDPTRDMGLTGRRFEDIVRKYQDANALVMFIDLPAVDPSQPLDLPKPHPKIIAAQLPIETGRAYLRNQVIIAFVANRALDTTAAKRTPRQPREAFALYYDLFTTTNNQPHP